MRKMWWKYLGAAILLYVLVFGMLTPLKPGISEITPYRAKAGQEIEVVVKGYNTQFDQEDTKAWLKLDADNSLPTEIVRRSRQELVLKTFIPKAFPKEKKAHGLTLVTFNKADGPTATPNAVTIIEATGGGTWESTDMSMLRPQPGIQFPYRSVLIETTRNVFFHVPLWFAMFILLVAGIWFGIKYLRKRDIRDDMISSSLTHVAILFGILGMITGSIWARFTWGTWWTSDPKLNMSTVAMLIYCAYAVLRNNISDVDRRAQISAAYGIFAFVAMIPLVIVIPRITDSLHPGNGGNPALGGEDLENTLRMAFYPAIIGFTLLGLWIASISVRMKELKERVN